MAGPPDNERCTFTFADGRRCRTFRIPTRSVCIEHWRHDGQFEEDEAANAALADARNALDSPRGINKALATLFRLTAQGKVPPRRAALLAYMAQLLLCSVARGHSREDVVVPLPDEEAMQPVAQLVAVKPGSNGSGG